MTKPWRKEYEGFESLSDYEFDLYWALSNEDVIPDGEWQGKLIITMEYFEEEANEDPVLG